MGGAGTSFAALVWSTDGKRLAYYKKASGQPKQSGYESVDIETGATVASLEGITFMSASALPDGRVVILEEVPGPPDVAAHFSNWVYPLSEIRTDPRTGAVLGPVRRLTNGLGSVMAAFTTRDGLRASLISVETFTATYITDLIPGPVPRLVHPRPLGSFNIAEYVHAWTPDSRTVIFESLRLGNRGNDLFRQAIDRATADPLVVTADENEWLAQMSPDGQWVLYRSDSDKEKVPRLMRVPPTGGSPELVPGVSSPGEFRCSISRAGRCVIRVRQGEQFVFYELNPSTGMGAELARTAFYPPFLGDWDISPDGAEVAIPNHSVLDATIRVVPLGNPQLRERTLNLDELRRLNGLTYAADGKGWYVKAKSVPALFYCDRQGRTSTVEGSLDAQFPVPSPNGRHVALAQQVQTHNVMLITGLPAAAGGPPMSPVWTGSPR